MANVPAIVAAVLAAIGLLLGIVGTATPAWRYNEEDGSSSSVGLFKSCYTYKPPSGETESECVTYTSEVYDSKDFKGWLKASQAFMILSILVTVACIVCIILRLAVQSLKESKALAIVSILLAYVAMVCALIGYAVFAGKTGGLDSFKETDLGYSFGLAAAASGFQLGAGIALTCLFCST